MQTLIDLFSQRAQDRPAAPAFTFLEDEREVGTLSWGDIDRRARASARRLQSAGLQPGDRVLVMQPPGLDYVVALVGILSMGIGMGLT